MQIPGEALLSKLWETLADKAIGNLLKPWQIRREGRANLDVKRAELIILAQAERDAEAIRRGVMHLSGYQATDQPLLLPTSVEPTASWGDNATRVQSEATIEPRALAAASSAAQADVLRREVNVARAILHAEEALESDPHVPAGDTPSNDWIYRWRDYAASVSSEELQLLWGRVLAGEVKAPGAYSVRFLNFLHNLDKGEAKLIAQAMPFVIDDFICSEAKEQLERSGLNFGNLLVLQELGLITGVEGLGLSKQFSTPPGQNFRMLIQSHDLALGFTANDGVSSLKIPAYIVTTLGRQLVRLGCFRTDREYLRTVGGSIKKQGFKVELGTPISHQDGKKSLEDLEVL